MITEERFNEIAHELESRGLPACGYWHVCYDHACTCAAYNKGFDLDTYNKMRYPSERELRELELENIYLERELERYEAMEEDPSLEDEEDWDYNSDESDDFE